MSILDAESGAPLLDAEMTIGADRGPARHGDRVRVAAGRAYEPACALAGYGQVDGTALCVAEKEFLERALTSGPGVGAVAFRATMARKDVSFALSVVDADGADVPGARVQIGTVDFGTRRGALELSLIHI